MKCDIRFDEPFGKSHCLTCGRQWEAMTPQGSMYDCLREIGSMVATMRAALEFYARNMGRSKSMDYRIIVQDGGKRAREALGHADSASEGAKS